MQARPARRPESDCPRYGVAAGLTGEHDVTALRRAVRLTGATVLWNVGVGGAAVATAVVSGSLALIGFGINAVVDSSVSCLLVWRFRAAAIGRLERIDRLERLAVRVAGLAFTIVAVYLTVRAVSTLVARTHSEASLFALAEALASVAVLPYLAVAKYRLSRALRSPGLRADSLLTGSGVALAAVALVSLLVQRATGWRFADPVGALIIAAALGWLGSRSLRGQ
jgi:divalent metal cation (Fe/Co/Zn/Cd) transporter